MQTSSIPTFIGDDHIYSDSTDKSNVTEQSPLDDTHASLLTDPQLPDYILDSDTVIVFYSSPKAIFEKL